MFCPVCKAEYRPGFKHCSDCDVDLVERIDAQLRAATAKLDDAYELLWGGNDPRIFQEFREALQAAGISFSEHAPGPSVLYTSLRPPMEIWTQRRDHDAVEAVRSQVCGEEEDADDQNAKSAVDNNGDTGAADADVSDEESEDSRTTKLGDRYFERETGERLILPKDATADVWAGDDDGTAQMLGDCLRENGIGSVRDSANGKARIRVSPSEESRAREIIREVVEATPPE